MANERETRILELVSWARAHGIQKGIPKKWIEQGGIPSIYQIREFVEATKPIVVEAQKRFLVSRNTAEDYAELVVNLLIQESTKNSVSPWFES